MELVIVSGMSGSGKSIALHMLEDLGYYCMDNLPLSLLEAFALRLADSGQDVYKQSAIGIDARSLAEDLREFPDIVRKLRDEGIETRVLFLQTETDTLLKRFSETRRKHPLTNDEVSLAEAIRLEQDLLGPISANADFFIDTTRTNVHQLRNLVRERVAGTEAHKLSLLFQSFGYKHGVPSDVDFVFDARCLPNPYWEPDLRPLTGLDQPVIDYLSKQALADDLAEEISAFLERWIPRFLAENRTYLTVAIGCTGGQHRSVFMAEKLARHFRKEDNQVLTMHREMT